ncbi:MAG: four helix bundle protein [bacterium]
MTVRNFKDLIVWQKGMELSRRIYVMTRGFPKEETYGMSSQLRRACVSIPANIAEGNGRSTPRDYAHFISMALGSAREVETLLLLSKELGFLDSDDNMQDALELLDEVSRMLHSIRRNLTPGHSNFPAG